MENQWNYRGGAEPHFQSIVSDSETGETVSVVYHDEGGEKAKLISKAPELLETLKNLMSYLQEIGTEDMEENDEPIAEFEAARQLLNELNQ